MITKEEIRLQLEEAGIAEDDWENASLIAKTSFIAACARAGSCLALARQSAAFNRIASALEHHLEIPYGGSLVPPK